MKQFILSILCMVCMGFVGCSGAPETIQNNISESSDNMVYTVVDCPGCRKELNSINIKGSTNKTTSAEIVNDIMNELEKNLTAAGFNVQRDDFNHITIK